MRQLLLLLENTIRSMYALRFFLWGRSACTIHKRRLLLLLCTADIIIAFHWFNLPRPVYLFYSCCCIVKEFNFIPLIINGLNKLTTHFKLPSIIKTYILHACSSSFQLAIEMQMQNLHHFDHLLVDILYHLHLNVTQGIRRAWTDRAPECGQFTLKKLTAQRKFIEYCNSTLSTASIQCCQLV